MEHVTRRGKETVKRSSLRFPALTVTLLVWLAVPILNGCATTRQRPATSEAGRPNEVEPFRIGFLGLKGAEKLVAPEQRRALERAALENSLVLSPWTPLPSPRARGLGDAAAIAHA